MAILEAPLLVAARVDRASHWYFPWPRNSELTNPLIFRLEEIFRLTILNLSTKIRWSKKIKMTKLTDNVTVINNLFCLFERHPPGEYFDAYTPGLLKIFYTEIRNFVKKWGHFWHSNYSLTWQRSPGVAPGFDPILPLFVRQGSLIYAQKLTPIRDLNGKTFLFRSRSKILFLHKI